MAQTSMMEIRVEPGHETKVISPEEMQRASWEGYRPMALFEETVYEPSRSYYDHVQGRQVEEPRVETHLTRLLVVRGEETALRSKQTEIDALQKRLDEGDKRVRDLQSSNQKHESTELELRQRIARLEEQQTWSRQEKDRAVDKARKLEVDIGKVRQALGDLRMKEILDGKA